MKKVFEGVRFDVYQRDQKIFDGTTTTFEMVKRKDAVQIIAIVGNKILVPQERHPHRTTSKYGLF